MNRTSPEQFRRMHSSPAKPASGEAVIHYISHAGMELIERLMAEDSPDPERSYASLVAEQERRRLLAQLRHRLTLHGA